MAVAEGVADVGVEARILENVEAVDCRCKQQIQVEACVLFRDNAQRKQVQVVHAEVSEEAQEAALLAEPVTVTAPESESATGSDSGTDFETENVTAAVCSPWQQPFPLLFGSSYSASYQWICVTFTPSNSPMLRRLAGARDRKNCYCWELQVSNNQCIQVRSLSHET